MTVESPLTTAWNRIREQLAAAAEAHRSDGTPVIEAVADHGTVHAPGDGPVEFVFTVPGDTVDALRRRVDGADISRTEIQYGDAVGHRLYLLTVHATDGPVVLVAGGVGRDRLVDCADAAGRARTRLRGVDGRVGVRLEHDDIEPFVGGLE
ncbi:hypothetical protein EKH57_09995 [Halorubrum sp. BOL3-1]|uniref:DUF7529 family protein n=1 Tax=Halorubrum sp. BOL3-1 TaxID=2497325 RepID=UPI00100501E7|nr:hypothetical protein [Halorubrum sp. BOL3-1]QAU13025.1 hypothetical protein EKH57_09995 [Halorubrum sp. BOL3-1]